MSSAMLGTVESVMSRECTVRRLNVRSPGSGFGGQLRALWQCGAASCDEFLQWMQDPRPPAPREVAGRHSMQDSGFELHQMHARDARGSRPVGKLHWMQGP